jgi:hypothetical protein
VKLQISQPGTDQHRDPAELAYSLAKIILDIGPRLSMLYGKPINLTRW